MILCVPSVLEPKICGVRSNLPLSIATYKTQTNNPLELTCVNPADLCIVLFLLTFKTYIKMNYL